MIQKLLCMNRLQYTVWKNILSLCLWFIYLKNVYYYNSKYKYFSTFLNGQLKHLINYNIKQLKINDKKNKCNSIIINI